VKVISREQLAALLEHGVVKNTKDGIVNQRGNPTGYLRTRHKLYMEDSYVEAAQKILLEGVNDG